MPKVPAAHAFGLVRPLHSRIARGIWRALLGLPVAAALLLLAGCGERLPTYRYRLTVEVDTPEGPRAGSSVIEVRTRKGAGFPGPEAGGIRSSMEGEAVVVDLGERGMLFALLSSPANPDYGLGIAPTVLLPELPDRRGTPEAWGENLRALKQVDGQAEVLPSDYPMLVRFRDLSIPTTVQEVRPENLQEHFGPRVRLRRITVEMTDEPVSQGIQVRLPWLSDYAAEGRRLSGNSGPIMSNDLPDNLGPGNFRWRF